MSEHTPTKLPDSIKREQLLAQLFDVKESLLMQEMTLRRTTNEVRSNLKRINNLIEIVEGRS